MCQNWKRRAIGLALRLDGVPYIGIGRSSTKSFEVLSWQGIASIGSSLDTKHLITGWFKQSESIVGNTCQLIWRYIIWSLRLLFLGIWPIDDTFGRSLADPHSLDATRSGKQFCEVGQYFGVLYIVKCDRMEF